MIKLAYSHFSWHWHCTLLSLHSAKRTSETGAAVCLWPYRSREVLQLDGGMLACPCFLNRVSVSFWVLSKNCFSCSHSRSCCWCASRYETKGTTLLWTQHLPFSFHLQQKNQVNIISQNTCFETVAFTENKKSVRTIQHQPSDGSTSVLFSRPLCWTLASILCFLF